MLECWQGHKLACHGGIVGLSTARVMQFAAINVRIMKSNQSWEVSFLQNTRALKYILDFCYYFWKLLYFEFSLKTNREYELRFLKNSLTFCRKDLSSLKLMLLFWRFFTNPFLLFFLWTEELFCELSNDESLRQFEAFLDKAEDLL